MREQFDRLFSSSLRGHLLAEGGRDPVCGSLEPEDSADTFSELPHIETTLLPSTETLHPRTVNRRFLFFTLLCAFVLSVLAAGLHVSLWFLAEGGIDRLFL